MPQSGNLLMLSIQILPLILIVLGLAWLSLASDGFNPFLTLSNTYTTWPVVLMLYNLAPWSYMKESLLILSMVIPGEKVLGTNIDILLQPLIKELI